jgi:hypothetical protein
MRNLYTLLILSIALLGCDPERPSPLPIPTGSVTSEPAPLPVPSEIPSPEPSPSPSPTPTDAPYRGDRAFQAHLNRFVSDGSGFGKSFDTSDLTIEFGDLSDWGSSVIGLCDTYGAPVVTIKESWWKKQSELQQRMLMHHELGHCLLMRGHRSGSDEIGPLSMMNPTILTARQYEVRAPYYLTELFTRDSGQAQAPEVHVCDHTHL